MNLNQTLIFHPGVTERGMWSKVRQKRDGGGGGSDPEGERPEK